MAYCKDILPTFPGGIQENPDPGQPASGLRIESQTSEYETETVNNRDIRFRNFYNAPNRLL
jgi:hypothetical protein